LSEELKDKIKDVKDGGNLSDYDKFKYAYINNVEGVQTRKDINNNTKFKIWKYYEKVKKDLNKRFKIDYLTDIKEQQKEEQQKEEQQNEGQQKEEEQIDEQQKEKQQNVKKIGAPLLPIKKQDGLGSRFSRLFK
jgi:uncharacterized membrane protein YukC